MIPVVWLAMLKKFGPWIGVVLVLVGIWFHGKSVGSSKWHGRYNAEVVSHQTCQDELSRASEEMTVLKGAIEDQNGAIAAAAVEYESRVAATQAATDRALRNQASSYRRQLDAAAEATVELRERVRTIEVAEACHESWLEVLK